MNGDGIKTTNKEVTYKLLILTCINMIFRIEVLGIQAVHPPLGAAMGTNEL